MIKAARLGLCFCGASLLSCHSGASSDQIDAIEVRTSGLSAEDIVIHSNGRGELRQFLTKRTRDFLVTPAEFRKLANVLRPYSRHARPVEDKSVWKSKCAAPSIDAGTIYLRWQGPQLNVHNVIDFGCKHWWQSYGTVLDAVADLERRALKPPPQSSPIPLR